MKRIVFTLSLVFSAALGFAQVCSDFAVQLMATTQVSPARITLTWKKLGDTTTYTIYRKSKSSLSWGAARATLSTVDSQYTDTAVVADSAYEYRVSGVRRTTAAIWPSEGYIYAAIKAPAIHSRGGMVLIVDSSMADSCAAGITQLMNDLRGDGWRVVRYDVPRTLADTGVKRRIMNAYNSIPNIKSVLLVGHVAVPYSGDQNPDGHPDHKGAWPTDHYYAYLSSAWGDAGVNDVSSSYPANRNVPGDGKWDPIGWTSRSELQVSRVDLSNMPAFASSEAQLLNSYLAKDHLYKMDSLSIRHRSLIDDNFGVFTIPAGSTTYYESFASSGWRNFAPLVGRDSIATTDFISSLDSGSFLWAYGCGGGSFTSAGGIGSTGDFATHNVNGIFTMLFGSYFGDWNVPNNFLRAPLCSNTPALTCCWSGRPFWFFHQMALGEHMGYCSWHSQNNDGNLYGPFSIGYQYVTASLMGDLSLRSEYVKPALALNATSVSGHGANLAWTASPDAGVIGYYVYRSDTGEYGQYNRISNMVTGTTFSDTVGASGLKFYMVRPVKLQSTPSGSYYNLGLGIVDSATVIYPDAVEQVSSNELDMSLFPNPAQNRINVAVQSAIPGTYTLTLMNALGEKLVSSVKYVSNSSNRFTLDISNLPSALYFVSLDGANGRKSASFVKQ